MRLKALIFEDDGGVLEVINYLIRITGYYETLYYREPTLCPLYSDPTCICTCEKACTDILITDNHMPNMTGLEFIRQQHIRGCKGITKHKAVMSATWSGDDLQLAEELGCKIFTKPFDIHEFLNWLDECYKAISSDSKQVEHVD